MGCVISKQRVRERFERMRSEMTGLDDDQLHEAVGLSLGIDGATVADVINEAEQRQGGDQ